MGKETVGKVKEKLEKEFSGQVCVRSDPFECEGDIFFQLEVSGQSMYLFNDEVVGEEGKINSDCSLIIPEEEGSRRPKGKLFKDPSRFECEYEYTALSNVIREKLGMESLEEE